MLTRALTPCATSLIVMKLPKIAFVILGSLFVVLICLSNSGLVAAANLDRFAARCDWDDLEAVVVASLKKSCVIRRACFE